MMPEIASSAAGRQTGADANLKVPDPAVETFRFEVSAGEAALSSNVACGGEESQELIILSELAVDEAHRKSSARAGKKRWVSKRVPLRAALTSSNKKSRWFPSWLASVLVHGALITSISFITIKSVEKSPEMLLSFSSGPQIPDEVNLEELSTDPLEEFTMEDGELASEVTATSSELVSGLSPGAELAELGGGGLAEGALGDGGVSALGDAAGLFGGIGGGGGGLGEIVPSGEKLTASFFGTKVDGRRILYVLDNSGGMQDGKLEALVGELLKSVGSLDAEQEFYVIFYSDMLYPLFYPRPVEHFVPANDRFKQRLKAWLDSVEFCVGNTVDEAIRAAATIRPDAVYLLTDGNVDTTPDGRKLAALMDSRGRDFPIHTFGIGMSESGKPAENLRQVAEANHGTFRTVEVSREARDRAKQMNRPYHNKEPGREWGINVGRGWGR